MSLEIVSEKEKNEVKATYRIRKDLFWDLKYLALDRRTNASALMNEAIHDILVKYGKRKVEKKAARK